jgi:hypothetical protein
MYRIDLWGGKLSQSHVARITSHAYASLVHAALAAGYLVNIRKLADGEQGAEGDFDKRGKHEQ